MKQNSWMRLLALMSALAMIAAACGGSDATEEAESEAATGGAASQEAVEEAMEEEDEADPAAEEGEEGEEAMEEEPAAAPTTFEELEAYWAENRQAVIDDIKANGYGINEDNILIGPGGMAVDLNECPSDWSDTEGVDGGEILISKSTALSGPAAAAGNIDVGIGVYFDWVNENHGGIAGLPLNLDLKDDGYQATLTIENVDEMLQSTKPFAVGTIGTPTGLAVYGTLNDACVPHPFAISGHPAWGDPVNHPWTTPFPVSYGTEALLWGTWIKNNLTDQLPVTVGALVMDNDFGFSYETDFLAYAEANPDVIADVNFVRHDPAAPTLTAEMTTIAAENPDVYISMTTQGSCLLAVEEAVRSGLAESASALFTSSTCKSNRFITPAADGQVGDNWLIVGGGVKTTTDPQFADDPWVSFIVDTLAAAGEDPEIGFLGEGFGQQGWAFVEALRIAAELDGGLTRTNFMLAQRAIDLDHPMLLEGISFEMNGNEDAYVIEGSEIARYDVATTSWIQEGPIVDLNGTSPNCEWQDGSC